ncbi:MAG: phosphate signaling complex protein PhoU [Thermodesulfobacteriota bacterium]
MPISHFHRQMEEVKEDLLRMAGLVEEAVFEAMRALTNRDVPLARMVIQSDRRVNALENLIEGNCIKLLATQQPVAVDLRFITSAMKISTFLERMGDQAVNLAERAQELSELDPMEIPSTLQQMAKAAQEMTRKCLDAFVKRDIALAFEVCSQDDELDALNRLLLEEMMGWMMREQRVIQRAVELIIAGRHLERIGDEATNISEEVVFLVEGTVIRHQASTRPDQEQAADQEGASETRDGHGGKSST